MDKIHQYGKEQGCTMATLSTMSFQNALGLYQKLGYKIDFEREGYVQSSEMLFLRKEL
jgi:ribosomal protein S18 acetylase RimI-like enzyme